MYSRISIDTSQPFTKKLLPYVENEQLLFKAIPFPFSMPYTFEEKLDILKRMSINGFFSSSDWLSTLKSYLTVNFINPVGAKAPDFALPTTVGETIKLSKLQGRYAVFMFVCMTCPAARVQIDQWDLLYKKYYKKDAQFFLIYARERHPGEPGYPEFKQPRNLSEKLANAIELSKLTDLPILIDTYEQHVARLYGKAPNQAFIVNREGNIAFKSGWSCSYQIEAVLDALLAYDLSQKEPI